MRKCFIFLALLTSLFAAKFAFAGIVVGNPQGTVSLVEFYDYQCPSCKAMAPVIEQLIKASPYLRVVYSNDPIYGPNSVFAAKAAIAAVGQNKFPQFHAALMASKLPLTQASVLAIAKQVGLDTDQLTLAMNTALVADELTKEMQLSSELGVRVTPTLVIGATKADREPQQFQGITDYQTLQTAVANMNTGDTNN